MCLVSWYFDSFLVWARKPIKNWYRLIKCALTILRSILFIVFLAIFITFYVKFTLDPTNSPKVIFPFYCLYSLIVYNWRFLVSILVIILLILIKLIHCASELCCFTQTRQHVFGKMKNMLKSIFRALNWSQIDWPCFLFLKYYMYIFDIFHYFIYLSSVIAIGVLELSLNNSNSALVITYFCNAALFALHCLLEIHRVVQSQRVEATIRDIFRSDVKFSKKARKMIPEQLMGSEECVHFLDCVNTDSKHNALCHPNDILKMKFEEVNFNQKGRNIVTGYHQTTIESARSILATCFRPSKRGMLGPGIYFANNYIATERKKYNWRSYFLCADRFGKSF